MGTSRPWDNLLRERNASLFGHLGRADVLTSAKWPGNVRQLHNVMERVVVTVNDNVITPEHLPAGIRHESRPGERSVGALAEAAEAAEKKAIQDALQASDCHREQTARMLGISVRTLHYKMSRYGLH